MARSGVRANLVTHKEVEPMHPFGSYLATSRTSTG